MPTPNVNALNASPTPPTSSTTIFLSHPPTPPSPLVLKRFLFLSLLPFTIYEPFIAERSFDKCFVKDRGTPEVLSSSIAFCFEQYFGRRLAFMLNIKLVFISQLIHCDAKRLIGFCINVKLSR
jgi:hypothetical protein